MGDKTNSVAILALLSQIRVIAQKNRDALRDSEWNFNVFHLCGVDHYENINSRILAEFLNPKGTHGVGLVFLRKFFDMLRVPFEVTSMTEVQTELSTDEGRMDIVIRDRELQWCVVIENKVFAAEQSEQLVRYWRWLNRNYQKKNIRLLFLTREGYESETATSDVQYTPVSYSDHIVQWLNDCIALSSEHPFVRETLRQYRNHIKSLTGQSMEEQRMKEVVDMLANANNFEAAQIIHKHYGEACQRIAAMIFADVAVALKGVCEIAPNAESPDLDSKDDGFKFVEPKTGVIIRIAPERKGYGDFFVGITKGDANQSDAALRKKMNDSWIKNDWWPSYKYLPAPFRWWSGEFLVRCLNDKQFRIQLVDTISSYVKEICTALQR